MKVQGLTTTNNTNNNSVFKAYFKEDSSGHLIKLYKEVKNHNKLQEAINLLKEKRPNHELEILKVKYFRGTEENSRVDWREATMSQWGYLVRNNENGHDTWIGAPAYYDHLTQIVDDLVKLSDDVFWRNKADEEKLYKSLVTQEKHKAISVAEKPKKMGPIDKIKDFISFWVFILKHNPNK